MTTYIIAIAALGVALLIVDKIRLQFIALRFKKVHGCKDPPRINQAERILGYGLYKTLRHERNNKILLENSKKRFQQNGNTYSSVIFGNKIINTIEPENIKAILATNFADFGVGDRLPMFGPLLGQGIFSTDGALWKHSRALVRPSFAQQQVADLGVFEKHVSHFMSKIPRDGSTVDLQKLFFHLTLDASTEFLFGESVNALGSAEGSDEHRFGTAFDYAQGKMVQIGKIDKLCSLFKASEFDLACQFVHEFVDRIVDKKLGEMKDEKTADFDEKADRYVFLEELMKETRDRKQLRDELLNILLAGRDTTASLLSHTFHVLARRPDIFAKLSAEIDQLEGKAPTYDDLKTLDYLKYLLNESLRLYPVVPGNTRFANKDSTLPVGGGLDGKSPIYVRQGDVVRYAVYSVHRRKDIYGPDAEEFKPERWAPENGLRPGWGYLPFNGGPRICIGQKFALTEAGYTIVRMMQEFNGIENRDPRPWNEQLTLTLAIGNGVQVAMTPRSN